MIFYTNILQFFHFSLVYDGLNENLCHQKKVLALVLAFACAFTMFAGAAFTDAADINADNTEAVDLLTTLGIIKGYEDGSFQPDGTVTRAEMAKMIYTIRNDGNDDASAYENVTTSFTDISGHWAEGYVKYLQNTGIVAGKSATRFDPDSQVTTGEAMKMALALGGYDEEHAGLTGINWLNNTVSLATTNGLTDDVASAISGGCTRQDAAQILSNALGMTAVRWSAVVEDFVNDSKDGLAFGGKPISVGEKWMDLCTDVGTLVSIDSNNLSIIISSTDEPDSYHDSGKVEFTRINTDYSSLLGQKVKVLFNNGKTNDVIGVYAVPDNNVVVVNQNEIGVDAGKIVIDGTNYSIDTDGVEVIIDGEQQADNWKAGAFKDEQSADVVTLIDTDDDNKIDAAYIKTVDVQKVTYVSSSQIIAGSKTYKFADDNIAEDVEKDDWVVITKNLYNDNNDVVIADKATGAVEATKSKTDSSGNAWKQFQIDGTWYNEAAINTGKDINSNVKPGVDAEYVAVNGILFYAAKTSSGSDKLTDVLFVAFVGKDGLSNDQARVMFPNGDKATINLKNDYVVDQDGDKVPGAIQDGAFYEYNKSGNTYELIELSTDADFYGDFTYRDTSTLAATGDMTYTVGGSSTTKAIADSADVIVWTMHGNTVDFKHITGKQLKALINIPSGGSPKVALGTSNGQLDTNLIGGFTSDVDGLNRASVLAVEYHSADGKLGSAFDDISSNANYGFITKDAVKSSNGMIRFTVWTGSENVEVYAEKSREADFTKGTIVGYTDIVTEDNRNVMTDANAITGSDVKAGSITSVNTDGDTIENNIGAIEDLDEYSTVLYVDSKAGTGVADGVATKANSLKVNGTTYYATNLLVYGTEVAVIDVNEIAGSRYGALTLPTISNLTDVQWLNTRTNDTDEGKAYKGAVMELSFYADADGSLDLDGFAYVEKNLNSDNIVINVEKGYNKIEGLIVRGGATLDATYTANGTTTPPAEGTVLLAGLTNATQTHGTPAKVTANLYSEGTSATMGRADVKVYSGSTDVTSQFTVDETIVFNNQGTIGVTPTTANAGTYTVKATFAGKDSNALTFTINPQTISAVAFDTDFTKPLASSSLAAFVPGTLTSSNTGVGTITEATVTNSTVANPDGDTLATGDTVEVTFTVSAATNYQFASGATASGISSGTAVPTVSPDGSSMTIVVTMTI